MSEPPSPYGTIVVIGGSLAGLRAAEELRHGGHKGPVVVIGDEKHIPYDRPPLSKQFLSGAWDEPRIHHHAPDMLDTLGLELRLGRRVESLDLLARSLRCDDGSDVAYDGLVVATGAAPLCLPGTDGLAGVHTLRTLEDSLAIRAGLEDAGEGARLVVVGAGFIGAEAAATCHGLGADVTITEGLRTPLARVLGEEMGEAIAFLHRENGVTVRTGVGVEGVESDPGGPDPVTVRLADGSRIAADLCVVGIGVTPSTGWLEGSGLTIDDGVVCDERLFAAPRVVAAGDVARWTHPGLGEQLRLEHWTNAAEGGAAAARSLMAGPGLAEPYDPVPFFWSDQYKTKIQMLGLPGPDDEVVVVSGSVTEGRLVALYRRGARLRAALAFSQARRLMAYRPLLVRGASFDDALSLSRS